VGNPAAEVGDTEEVFEEENPARKHYGLQERDDSLQLYKIG
jgi:hypothetical protein